MNLSKFVFPALIALALATPVMANAQDDKAPSERPARFHPADKDQDGKLTRAEYDAFSAERFQKMDTNADGVVTAEEMQANRKARMDEIKKHRGERGPHMGKEGHKALKEGAQTQTEAPKAAE